MRKILDYLFAAAMWVWALLLLLHAASLPSYRETVILTILALSGVFTLYARTVKR